jgi:hypothetical protein
VTQQGPQGVDGEENSKLLTLTTTKGLRMESELDAYTRDRGEERTEKEVATDWKQYLDDCKKEGKAATIPFAGRRNQYISKLFKAESPEYRAKIRASRRLPHTASPAMILASLMDPDNNLHEEDRREHARLVQG